MALDHDRTTGVPVGNGQYISPAEFLLMAGFLAYRAPLAAADARAAARRVVDAILGVAAAHGFAYSDTLASMMTSAETSTRAWRLAELATAAVGDTVAYLQVIRSAGVTLEADL
ncbi:hypothetical protein LMG28727_06282 [Paraburkholderia kirstenboschensis]|uniref:hypothetical protein n=1 Tax=Paraburkholderia kirstenboschensis TaxID=1245436 RepID=UPI000AAC2694|nr:hypothetical protein [Paraburkholderia kirstenboschensis]CAD6557114.1 hypothetical protein LMG28727_06282 [Paraburkholderia kirstenboschensis]